MNYELCDQNIVGWVGFNKCKFPWLHFSHVLHSVVTVAFYNEN